VVQRFHQYEDHRTETGEILRLTASLILRKLGSYPRQNSLALALRESGRIERTLFMLAWLEDPALRRRVTAGLNKGEAQISDFLSKSVILHSPE
jgi:TnpA family transposase